MSFRGGVGGGDIGSDRRLDPSGRRILGLSSRALRAMVYHRGREGNRISKAGYVNQDSPWNTETKFSPSSIISIEPPGRRTLLISWGKSKFMSQQTRAREIPQIDCPTEDCVKIEKRRIPYMHRRRHTLFSGTALAMLRICTWSNSSSSNGSFVVRL